MTEIAHQLTNVVAFEIYSPETYQLALAICPALAEIKYEALLGHYFGLSEGPFQFATFPPGALKENGLIPRVGEFRDVTLLRFVPKQ